MRIPTATYRVQIHAGFTLRDALDLVPYLSQLGISHLYLSPVFEASPGSTHGYDVVDPTRVSSILGGLAALEELAAAAKAHGMGIVLDIVPNHMAASELNPWWRDVMRHGRHSRFARFFDIAWDAEPVDRLLLPVLGREPDDAIDAGELTLVIEEDGPAIRYFDRFFPVADASLSPALIDEALSPDPDARRNALQTILARQHYELAHWRRTAHAVGYRRFFDITDLAGVRVEDSAVFDATHVLVRDLVARGIVDGLRIDHIDGLLDAAGYLDRLREQVTADGPVYTVVEKILELGEALPDWPVEGTTGYDFLNDVSGLFIDPAGMPRLLAQYHRMTANDATFDEIVRDKKRLVIRRLFAGEVTALTERLVEIFAALGADADSAANAAIRRALELVTVAMPVYRTYITESEFSRNDHRHLDQALYDAHEHALDSLGEEAAPVVGAIDTLGRILQLDVPNALYAQALAFVQRWQQLTGPVMAKGVEDTALYTFTALTSANEVGGGPAQPCVSVGEFHERMRTRATTMPLTLNATATHDTKRGEDVRTRIHALTELADDWTRRLRVWVQRSEVFKEEVLEDVAAELADDVAVPDAKEEILLYQTLVGAWPPESRPADDDEAGSTIAFTDRVKEYMRKAIREAKDNTSWAKPDEDYETALDAFLERLLRAPSRPRLRADINDFADRVAWHGMLGSLAQTLIKIAAPGIPDFYQGTELWSLVLVDPDNRRPVDFTARADRLAGLGPMLDVPSADDTAELLRTWRDGSIKMYVTAQALRYRRARPRVFVGGEYIPVHATGEHADRVVAFARGQGDEWCLLVVPRITAEMAPPGRLPVGDGWGDTALELPEGLPLVWRNVLTGEEPLSMALRDVFRSVPLALMDGVM